MPTLIIKIKHNELPKLIQIKEMLTPALNAMPGALCDMDILAEDGG